MAAGTIQIPQFTSHDGPTAASRWRAWLPYVLAIVFGLLSLRGVAHTDVVDTDAARHAMNGAFIYDMVRNGRIADPIEFGKEYYGHLPAVSLPYHPPAFPALESLFYAVFGVNLWAARLAIAVAVAISTILLYRLVMATLGSYLLAACVTITTFSVWQIQAVATDVMLEIPALMFMLAALYSLWIVPQGYSLGRALVFTLLAAAAVWTKQHAVFLGIMPVIYPLLLGRWRILFGKALWISSVAFGAGVVALISLSNPFHGTGVNTVRTAPENLRWIFVHNSNFYGSWITSQLLGIPGLFALCAVAAYGYAVYQRKAGGLSLQLYWAWIIAFSALLLFLGERNGRYLVLVIPATVVVGYAVLYRGSAVLWDERRARYTVVAFAALWCVAGLWYQPEFLRGPGAAAALIMKDGPTRVLYCGRGDGNFVFAVRSLDSQLRTTVISCDKIPAQNLETNAVQEFCRRYGIAWIALEDTNAQPRWSALGKTLVASMDLQKRFPLESSRSHWRQGTIDIFRVHSPSMEPRPNLAIPVNKIGGTVDVHF